jgi:transposase-like protein
MARQLTPDDRARIVARYQELANACRVAEEFDVDEKTVRNVIKAAGAPSKSDLHARACARGVRAGRRALTRTASRLERWLSEHGNPDSPTMEPGDVARIATALRGIVSGVIECDEHRDRKALSRLSRQLRRQEIELARLKVAAGGVERHEHTIAVDPAALAAEVFGSTSNLSHNADAPVDAELSRPDAESGQRRDGG